LQKKCIKYVFFCFQLTRYVHGCFHSIQARLTRTRGRKLGKSPDAFALLGSSGLFIYSTGEHVRAEFSFDKSAAEFDKAAPLGRTPPENCRKRSRERRLF
jgi:hypothetical protein